MPQLVSLVRQFRPAQLVPVRGKKHLHLHLGRGQGGLLGRSLVLAGFGSLAGAGAWWAMVRFGSVPPTSAVFGVGFLLAALAGLTALWSP